MGFKDRFLRFNRRMIAGVTTVLLVGGLAVVYFLGVSLTRVAMLFSSQYRLPRRDQPTYWVDAEGYAPTLEEARGQS